MPSSSIADVGDRERDRLAVGDRLAERDALVDVGDHVVQHSLRGADRERAPRDAGAVARTRRSRPGRRRRAAPAPAGGRLRAAASPVPAARTPIAGLAFTNTPSAPWSRRRRGPGRGPPAARRRRRTARAPRPAATSDLTPSSTQSVALAARGRLQLERVEQRPRLQERERRGGRRPRRERGQVGRLLVAVAPQRRRGRGRARREQRVRRGPRSPCASASAARTVVTAERSLMAPPSASGTPSMVSPSSAACAEDLLRRRRSRVRGQRGRPQPLGPERRTPPGASAARRSG